MPMVDAVELVDLDVSMETAGDRVLRELHVLSWVAYTTHHSYTVHLPDAGGPVTFDLLADEDDPEACWLAYRTDRAFDADDIAVVTAACTASDGGDDG